MQAWLLIACFSVGAAWAQEPAAAREKPIEPQAAEPAAAKPFEPQVGQAGRDVVWVPTPAVLVEKMLDVAKVTAKDFVMDLGSGDGRNIIAAARRGANALGVEYNPDMVEHSRRLAEKAGVADKARFVQGDMYEADISKASVLALFLLPENMNKLVPKFLGLKPGSRIVANQFAPTGWEADETGRVDGECGSWCTWLLYIVPARAEGRWRFQGGELEFEQKFQMLTGKLTVNGASKPVEKGRLRGEQIMFTVDGREYRGVVNGDAMVGAGWNATKIR
ncbi:MAG: class I SAM-dependent methyltransferase [Betaproteobacteria bacterium]|nr:class I SAM-dependent methyltransferase [Betaproteobacteria bacterium]